MIYFAFFIYTPHFSFIFLFFFFFGFNFSKLLYLPPPSSFPPSIHFPPSFSLNVTLRSQSVKEKSASWRITRRGRSGRSSVRQEMRPWCHQYASQFHHPTRRLLTLPAGKDPHRYGLCSKWHAGHTAKSILLSCLFFVLIFHVK